MCRTYLMCVQNIHNEMVINCCNEQTTPTILNFKISALYTLTNFHNQLKLVISVKFGTLGKMELQLV